MIPDACFYTEDFFKCSGEQIDYAELYQHFEQHWEIAEQLISPEYSFNNHSYCVWDEISNDSKLLNKMSTQMHQISHITDVAYYIDITFKCLSAGMLISVIWLTPYAFIAPITYEFMAKPLIHNLGLNSFLEYKPLPMITDFSNNIAYKIASQEVRAFNEQYIYPITMPVTEYLKEITIDNIIQNGLWSTLYFNYYTKTTCLLTGYSSMLKISHTVISGLSIRKENVDGLVNTIFTQDTRPLNYLPGTEQIIGYYTEKTIDLQIDTYLGKPNSLSAFFIKKLASKGGKIFVSSAYQAIVDYKDNNQTCDLIDKSYQIVQKAFVSTTKKGMVKDFKVNRFQSLMLPYAASLGFRAFESVFSFIKNISKTSGQIDNIKVN